MNAMNEQTSVRLLQEASQRIETIEEMTEADSSVVLFKRTVLHAIDSQTRLIGLINNLLINPPDSTDDSSEFSFFLDIEY